MTNRTAIVDVLAPNWGPKMNAHPSHVLMRARNTDGMFCVRCNDLRLHVDQYSGYAAPCSPSVVAA